MKQRIRVGVIFGGKSGEHEVSIQSGQSIMNSLDPDRYTVVPIGITRKGRWIVGDSALPELSRAAQIALGPASNGAAGGGGAPGGVSDGGDSSVAGRVSGSGGHGAAGVHAHSDGTASAAGDPQAPALAPALASSGDRDGDGVAVPEELAGGFDVVIPVLHGPNGEDGTIQGMLELFDVPYVGAGVLASAVGMDKVVMKQLFGAAGLPQTEFTFCTRCAWELEPQRVLAEVEAKLGFPCFVKPANMGSSVGITKVKQRTDLAAAIDLAAHYDRKVIIERGLDVREVEVAVLGNDDPEASVPGEVLPAGEFYDYRAKYVSGESELIIPAPLPSDVTEEIRRLAVQAYRAVDCSGLARLDFFVERGSYRVLVNEVNTMPGFTRYSMYPKLWEATGVSYPELLDKLITLAIERSDEKRRSSHDLA